MKSLVIYYSKTGNTKLMAETMSEEIKADVLAIKPQKEIKSRGFMLYMRGGLQSISKRTIKLEDTDIDLQDDYDLIIIGTPVWAGRLNPVVRSFLKKNQFANKKFGLFCTCASKGDGVLEDLRNILSENEILGEIQFIEPLKKETEAAINNAKEWINEILKRAQ